MIETVPTTPGKSRRLGITGLLGVLAGLCCQGQIAFAQWAASGNDIYNTNSGKVGIGTSGPESKLHVSGGRIRVGDISGEGTAGWTNKSIEFGYDNGANDWGTIISYDRTASSFKKLAIDGAPLIFNINSGGNLGIGTASPASRVDVRGEIRAGGNGTGSYGLRVTYDGTSDGGSIQARNFQNSLDRPLFLNPDGGNVGIGTTNPSARLHVAGNVTVDGNISAKYQDLAEWVVASRSIPVASVVVLDTEHSNQVLPSCQAYDTSVAGVVSDTPGILLGEGGEGKIKVASTGRVKVKVDAAKGSIRVGDLLVTSDKEGTAMRSEPVNVAGVAMHRPGTLVGKALEPLTQGEGEILVLLSLQ